MEGSNRSVCIWRVILQVLDSWIFLSEWEKRRFASSSL